MYIYIAIVFIIAWSLHNIIQKYHCKKMANLIVVIILFPVCSFAMGFRDINVGVDTVEYKIIFDDYLNYNWNKIITDDSSEDRIELGFKILMKVCGEIYPNYYFYQFIFSIIYIFLNLNLIYRYTSNVILTCAFFLGGGMFMQAFNIARQMFAVAIVGYAIISLLNDKFFKSIFIIIISYFFHSSSLIVLILVLLYPFRKYKFAMTIAPIILIILIILINDILLQAVFVIFGDKYLEYIINDYSRPNTGIMTKMMWIINFIVAITIYYFGDKKQYSIKFLALSTLIAVSCFWVGLFINYADRMGLYFLPCILLLYDKVGESIKSPITKYLYTNGLTLFYIIYFCYWTSINKAVSYNVIFN